jgi:hypothetical protein
VEKFSGMKKWLNDTISPLENKTNKHNMKDKFMLLAQTGTAFLCGGDVKP